MSDNLFSQNNAAQEETQETAIEATLNATLFAGRDNAFFVGRFTGSEGDHFTVAGEMLAPSIGDDYILNGRWTVHPKYDLEQKSLKMRSYIRYVHIK